MRIKNSYHRPTEPTRDEMGDTFRYTPIVKLGRLAMWNSLTKRVIDLRSPTLGFLKNADPDTFETLINSPKPVFGL